MRSLCPALSWAAGTSPSSPDRRRHVPPPPGTEALAEPFQTSAFLDVLCLEHLLALVMLLGDTAPFSLSSCSHLATASLLEYSSLHAGFPTPYISTCPDPGSDPSSSFVLLCPSGGICPSPFFSCGPTTSFQDC